MNTVPGSIIYSDCWRAYDNIKNENYVHLTVNHSQNFVDSKTEVHTQNVERLWREMRCNIPRFGKDNYEHYISEFFFKRLYNFDKRIDVFF